jgi:DNA-binding MarR family transcriptional regulator
MPRNKTTDHNHGEGRFSYEGLERVVHEKARLGILASLAANPGGVLFNDLKQLCSLTDGNLSRHLAVLADAGLVETWKGSTGPRPQTMYRLTAEGRQRFAEYISVLEKVVADAHADAKGAAGQEHLAGHWSRA